MRRLFQAAAVFVLTLLPYCAALGQSPTIPLPIPMTFQGTMTLSAATSTTLTSGNVTMDSSTTLPTKFYTFNILNTGSTNAAFVCIRGGTASATSGCTAIAPGAAIQINPDGFATVPTFFSTSGTTLAFWD